MNWEIVFRIVSIVIGVAILLVQVGRWGGRVETRRPLSLTTPPAISHEVIERIEQTIRETRALAHEARNIANVAKGDAAATERQVERDMERIERALTENTRRIDELFKIVRLRNGEGV